MHAVSQRLDIFIFLVLLIVEVRFDCGHQVPRVDELPFGVFKFGDNLACFGGQFPQICRESRREVHAVILVARKHMCLCM